MAKRSKLTAIAGSAGQDTMIRIVTPSNFDADTAQTPGSQRLTAIARDRGIATGLWAGIFKVEPGARTGIHHHGKQETIAYVLEGQCRVRWGERGEFDATASAGDFIHVPPWLPHMEINGSDSAPLLWIVVRSTPVPIVVNLPHDYWTQV
jgi:uncharacterized RmlC-like cupin family protein